MPRDVAWLRWDQALRSSAACQPAGADDSQHRPPDSVVQPFTPVRPAVVAACPRVDQGQVAAARHLGGLQEHLMHLSASPPHSISQPACDYARRAHCSCSSNASFALQRLMVC